MQRGKNIHSARNTDRHSYRKRGSYIVEAALGTPIFLMAMVVLFSVVLYYAAIEDSGYIAAMELRKGAAEAIATEVEPLIPVNVEEQIQSNNPLVNSVWPEDYFFRGKRAGMDELIALKLRLNLKTNNPLGIRSQSSYKLSLMTRAYVGKVRKENPMSEAEFRNEMVDGVFIFPQDGERYHNKNCTFVRSENKMVPLDGEIRRKYRSCDVCHSQVVSDGTVVYVFPNYGTRYHQKGCGVLRRRCIEIEKETAKERGYTPCSKCGG